jgi:hypothetical protein
MKKIVLELQGGLGNQLFQLATAISVSKHGNHLVVIDKSHYLRRITREYEIGPIEKQLGLKSSNLARIFYQSLPRVTEGNEFEPFPFIPAENSSYKIKGYFQNIKNIQSECTLLVKTLSEHFMSEKGSLSQQCCHKKHVGIHIRRGDYEQIEVNSVNFGVLNDQYFLSAIEEFDPETSHLVFYTETKQLSILDLLDRKYGFKISLNQDEPALMLLEKMSKNDAFIMSNSSLSWWTAKLIRYRNPTAEIIAPDVWFRRFPKSNSLIDKSWHIKRALWKSSNDQG